MLDLGILSLRYGGFFVGTMTIVIASLCLAQLGRELKACRTRREARNVWVEINWVVGYATAFLSAATICLIASF
jgi:hypothetical protein